MNILFLDQFSAIGGGQRSLLDLLPLVRRRGWNARMVLPAEGALAQAARWSGLDVDMVPAGAYRPVPGRPFDYVQYGGKVRQASRAISALIDRQRTHLLYVNGPRFLPGAALAARARSIPLVFHSHHRLIHPLAARVAGQALRWCHAHVIACCHFAAEPLEHYAACRVVYNGTRDPSWVRCARNPRGPWRIGVIGRIEPEKGQREFAAAARLLLQRFPDCRFVVAGAPLFSGPGYFEKVKEACRDLPFEFPGWQDDAGAVFSGLDLLVVPSTDIDSTPRVIIEAFAGGIPVVAFPSGGIPEIVDDCRTGFLAAEPTPEALAERIASVLSMDSWQLKTVTGRARERWRERYRLDRFQREVAEVVERAAS